MGFFFFLHETWLGVLYLSELAYSVIFNTCFAYHFQQSYPAVAEELSLNIFRGKAVDWFLFRCLDVVFLMSAN